MALKDTMSDLISRGAVIRLLVEKYKFTTKEAAETLDELPPAEPKKGKWIKAVKDGVLSYTDAYAQCDQCHKVTFNGWVMNYCPNCGAKMRGEEE